MIIGLTGNPGSGKGSVAKILAEEGFISYSLSDVIREYLKSNNIEITRQNLIDTGKRLRKEKGKGILAKKLIEKLEEDKDYVIDSFRHPGEVEVFREKFDDFILIEIHAPLKICLERIIDRDRENDPRTLSEFKTQLNKETKLQKTRNLAYIKLINDSTLEELKKKVLDLLEEESQY